MSQKELDQTWLNEQLAKLDNELNTANDRLTELMEEDEDNDDRDGDDFLSSVDYWSAEISRINNEMQSLLKSL